MLAATCPATPKLKRLSSWVSEETLCSASISVLARKSTSSWCTRITARFQYRQTFVDVNGIYELSSSPNAPSYNYKAGSAAPAPALLISQEQCAGTAVCTTSTSAVGSSTHFQLHFGAGLQIALTNHFFVRPQFDLHYVPNFTDQFGHNVVPEATVAVGYHFGER